MALPRFTVLFLVCLPLLPARTATFSYTAPPAAIQKVYGRQAFQFGYLTVPEKRANPVGAQIQLAVVILRAKQPSATALPVFFLTGGPGGSATTDAAYFEIFPALQNQHDVVLIDQRGAGYSSPFLGITRGTYASARAGFVNRGIDVTAYNTTENAADIADLRVALGYSQIVLLGNSYGTFLAQEIMRSHPTGIAAVVLDGVLPAPNTFIPPFNGNTLHGLNALFRDVRRTGPARRAFPNFFRTYFELLRRLRERPLRMDDGFAVTIDDFQNTVIGLLQSPERIRLVPLLVTEIAARRGSPFVRRYLDSSERPRDFSLGMYLSTLGTDWNQPGWIALTRRTDARLRPIVFRQANAESSLAVVYGVRAWDVPYQPLVTRNFLQSPIPALLLSGDMEAQTPFNGALQLSAGLPNSFVLAFPRSGHITGFTPGPALNAIVQFVNDPSQKPTYSLGSLRRPNFYATKVPTLSARSREEERPLRFLR